MGRVHNCNLYIRSSSHERLLVILCIGSTDLVKVAIALNHRRQVIILCSVDAAKPIFLDKQTGIYGFKGHKALMSDYHQQTDVSSPGQK